MKLYYIRSLFSLIEELFEYVCECALRRLLLLSDVEGDSIPKPVRLLLEEGDC